MSRPAAISCCGKDQRTVVDTANTLQAPRGVTRRRAVQLLGSLAAATFVGGLPGRASAFSDASGPDQLLALTPEDGQALFQEALDAVLPIDGFQSRIALRDSLLKLVAEGVIDPQRFASVYEDRGGLPVEQKYRLRWPSHLPIHLTTESAEYYVNLLWPVGLANAIPSNRTSPMNGSSLPNFASTAGWTLGKEDGASYFNSLRIVELTQEQEKLATQVASNTFRPCCGNSTFFQDCNHGSALFGLLQLGASQGLGEEELYEEALAFNSHWFPQTYVQTAVYFKLFEEQDWRDVDPKLLMSARYSALGPWQATVESRLAGVPNLLPKNDGGIRCGT